MAHRVVLAGGGTGGHVYPALAMGDALLARGHQLFYYGDAGRLEGRVAPERGYAFRAVEAAQYPRGGVLAKLRFAFALLRSIRAARRLLRADQASLVLGVGGYVMAPTVLAAWTLGIPAAIHEANVTPGLANQLCARVASLVLLTYAETARHLRSRAPIEEVGCPVNPKILGGDRAAAAERYGLDPAHPTLLVVGGSLGAATINKIGIAVAQRAGREFQVVHVTGPKYHDEVRKAYGTLPARFALVGYEDRIGDAYALADLVVGRAGSSTLAELCAVGRGSVLIPSPNVTENHQEGNARALEAAGAARVYVEKGLDVAEVVERIVADMSDGAALQARSAAAARLGRPQVADRVADLLEQNFGRGR